MIALPTLLWPPLIYIGAALLVPRLRPWLSEPARTFALLLSSVVAFVVILLALPGADDGLRWTLSNWGGADGLGPGIQFQVDALGRSFLLLSGLLGMAALAGSLDETDEVSSHDYQAGLLVVLASMATVALAGNLLTVLLAGLLLDAGLIFGVGLAGRPRWFLVTLLPSLTAEGLTLLATLLLWRDTGTTALAGASERVALLVLAAAVARMAPLPFSLFPVAFERLPQRVLALLPLTTLGLGSLLLARLVQASVTITLPDLAGLAPIAALGGALAGWVAWRREEGAVRLMMLSAWLASWVLWAFAWGFHTPAIATAWSGVLALGALAIHGGRVDFRHGTQLPAVLAALMVIGAPVSALWQAATTLSGAAWLVEEAIAQQQGGASGGPPAALGDPASWLMVVAAVGTMGAMAALLSWLIVEEAEPHQPSRWIGVTLLAALSVPAIGRFFGVGVPILSESSPVPSPLVAQIAVLVIGWAGGLWLWRVRRMLHPLHPFLDMVASFFSFVWLWRLLGRVGWLLLSGLRGMMLVLEGENYGWLLLFLFVTLIFLAQR